MKIYDLQFYPDKPQTADPKRLDDWEKTGNYICERKVDGWRMELEFLPQGIKFISRHGRDFTNEISPEIIQDIKKLAQLIPPHSRIDGEWLARRSCSVELKTPPKLILFDILKWDTKWWFSKTYQERRTALKEIMDKTGILPTVSLSESSEMVGKSFSQYFEQQKKIPWSEGVVIKHRLSKWKAGKKTSEYNPLWFKCKWRGGIDGETKLNFVQE